MVLSADHLFHKECKICWQTGSEMSPFIKKQCHMALKYAGNLHTRRFWSKKFDSVKPYFSHHNHRQLCGVFFFEYHSQEEVEQFCTPSLLKAFKILEYSYQLTWDDKSFTGSLYDQWKHVRSEFIVKINLRGIKPQSWYLLFNNNCHLFVF